MQTQKIGKLFVIEGGDGSGKTSVIDFLKTNLPKGEFVFTREPGGTDNLLSEKIRDVILNPLSKEADPATLFMLFWASRIEHITKTIWPAMYKGMNVVTDRFDSSTFAYQIRGQMNNTLSDHFDNMRWDYIHPLKPVYIFLSVEPLIGKKRGLAGKGEEKNHFDEREIDFYHRVQSGYVEFMKTYGFGRATAINANLLLADVQTQVLNLIKAGLPL